MNGTTNTITLLNTLNVMIEMKINQHTIEKLLPVAFGGFVVYVIWKARQNPSRPAQAAQQSQVTTPAQAQVQSSQQAEFTPSPDAAEFVFPGSQALRAIGTLQ